MYAVIEIFSGRAMLGRVGEGGACIENTLYAGSF
jgi:hypothetical protein